MALWLNLKRWQRDRRSRALRPAVPRHTSSVRNERRVSRALLELSRSATATHDWCASIRQLVQFEANALGVERVSFWSLSDETSSIHCEAGYVASDRLFEHGATLFQADIPEYFAAMREARVLNIENVVADPRCQGLNDYCGARAVSSMLDIPVWVEGRLAGVLCHEHVGPTRRWTAAEEEFAIGAAQIVTAALMERAHTKAETAAGRAAFLDSVSRVIPRSLDANEIAARAVSLVVPRLADIAVIWTLNRNGALELAAAYHADPRKSELVARVARSIAATGQGPAMASSVVRQRQAVLVSEIDAAVLARFQVNESQRAALASLGVRSLVGVPLAVAEKTFGAMQLLAERRRYGEDDLRLAEEVGDRIASALENARLYGMAREAIQARDEFLVLASHELRTPLTALWLSADDALRRAGRSGDPREEKRCTMVVHQVRRLGALVERMLEAVQTRAAGIVLLRQPCELVAVAERGVQNLSERAGRAGCRVTIHALSRPAGHWDRARLDRVVCELLDNAVKFGAGAPIEVVVDQDAAHAVLTVRDRGPGIAPDRLPSIFSPFERAVPKEHFGGLGLGLYIAKEIVDAHGGTIAATNDAPGGATFVVRLPLARDPVRG
jgi:signal transduction histidine kinase